MATQKHGVNARLYMGATTAIPVAGTHGLKVTADTDFAEQSAQGDPWKTRLPGLSDFSIEIQKFYDSLAAGWVLFDAVIARTVQKFYFYPDAADSANYIYGTGYLGGSGFDAPIGGIVDQSYKLVPTTQPTAVHV